ncbi:Band 4.1-like protein 3, partial [Geodia barretti]
PTPVCFAIAVQRGPLRACRTQPLLSSNTQDASVMSLSKKKGSFTLSDQKAEDAERISGRAGGSNLVRVRLLDGSVLTVGPSDKKMLGQVAFDHVVRKLDLLERDYFGLMYEDDHKKMQWLDLLKPIKEAAKKAALYPLVQGQVLCSGSISTSPEFQVTVLSAAKGRHKCRKTAVPIRVSSQCPVLCFAS